MLIALSFIRFLWNISLGSILNLLWASLCIPVYAIIKYSFSMFIRIAELDISSSVNINEIYQRVTMIITIVMTFYVAFSIIQYTINPDTVSDKEKGAGKIVSRIVIAILLIAFVPNIFSLAYKLQNKLIETQIFSKIILGEEVDDYATIGSSFAADTFSAFYRVNYDACGDNCEAAESHVRLVINGMREYFTSLFIITTIGSEYVDGVEFDGLLALIFGCYAVYVLFLYEIDVAVRCIQLLFLQIVAPIAIMSYIIPSKNNMLQKWAKQCATTYLDLFIRISIMYFAMLLFKVIGRTYNVFETSAFGRHYDPMTYITYIFFIVGVLIFIQRVPKLLKELFPESGAASIGFGTQWKTRKEPLMKSINSIKKPISTTIGGVSSAISTFNSMKNGRLKEALKTKYGDPNDPNTSKENRRKSRLEGWYSVGKSAFAGGKSAAGSNSLFGAYADRDRQADAAAEQLEKGGSNIGHDFRGIYYEGRKRQDQHYLDGLKAVRDAKKAVSDAQSELKTIKTAQSLIADWQQNDIGDPTKRAEFVKKIEKLMRVHAAGGIDRTGFESELAAALTNAGVGTAGTAEFDTALNGIMAQFDKDQGSGELHLLQRQIEEARKITITTKKADGTTLFEWKDGTGQDINVSTDAAFAENIGDVDTAAQNAIVDMEFDRSHKEAVANANVPGQKGGSSGSGSGSSSS